jgi:hypothetical protein
MVSWFVIVSIVVQRDDGRKTTVTRNDDGG